MRCEDCNVEMTEKRVDGKGAAIGAAVGAFLLGPVGLLGGAALGARGKHWVCPNCGKKIDSADSAEQEISLQEILQKKVSINLKQDITLQKILMMINVTYALY